MGFVLSVLTTVILVSFLWLVKELLMPKGTNVKAVSISVILYNPLYWVSLAASCGVVVWLFVRPR